MEGVLRVLRGVENVPKACKEYVGLICSPIHK